MSNLFPNKARICSRAARLLAAASAFVAPVIAAAQSGGTAPTQTVLGLTPDQSSPPHWPQRPAPAAGAPNILLVLTDDIGFGATSTFGGPVPTPNIDALAARGLKYNRFHTSALCATTRAALLTGRNPHRVGFGHIPEQATGFDGYNTIIPDSAGTVAQALLDAGYATAAFGKWHLTPTWEQTSAGPFDHWPSGLGFQYFYGFLPGATDQWAPLLTQDNRAVPVPDEPGYIFENDMADHAIAWLHEQHALTPDKPFFMYYAPGTAHAPQQAPKEWLDKFKGKFDQGWDQVREETFARQKRLGVIPVNAVLTPRPDSLPAWDGLPPEKKQLYARYMEAFAAQVSYMDHEFGRVINSLRASGQLDNTLVIFIQGDNGGSAEGGIDGMFYQQSLVTNEPEDLDWVMANQDKIGGREAYNLYPAAWGWATNTPFDWWKQAASHFGGTRNGMVVSWPKGIQDTGTVRNQFSFVTDIMPTILDAAGVEPPEEVDGVEQMSLDGISLRYSFDAPDAPSARRMQVFEMFENLAIYKDGWVAGTLPKRNAWEIFSNPRNDLTIDKRTWVLYNVDHDFSESRDVSERYPEKLKALQRLFWAEAGRNKILPINPIEQGDWGRGRPSLEAGRTDFTYFRGMGRVPDFSAPNIPGKSYTLTAKVVLPTASESGILVTQGTSFGGYAFYLRDGKLAFHYNALGPNQYRIESSDPVPAGAHTLSAEFAVDEPKPGSGGTVTLKVDGTRVASGVVAKTLPGRMSLGLTIGRAGQSPATPDFGLHDNAFTGELQSVNVHIDE